MGRTCKALAVCYTIAVARATDDECSHLQKYHVTAPPPKELGTFTLARNLSTCTAITAELRRPADDDCMRVSVASIRSNLSPMNRFIDEASAVHEMSIAGMKVRGFAPGGLNLSYECPPNGFNGFDEKYGSYCVTEPDTQLWVVDRVVGKDGDFSRIQAIRVILSGKPFTTPTVDQPPFGTAIISIAGAGIDLALADDGTDLAICPQHASTDAVHCAVPSGPPLFLNLTMTGSGLFRTSIMPSPMASIWYQDDPNQLLRLGPMPQTAETIQTFYFNGSGFYVATNGNGNANQHETQCSPFAKFCDYKCEVYNYDSRFLDYVGTWDLSWKLDFDGLYSSTSTKKVHAFIGNAIDAVGVFPCIAYMTEDMRGYVGLDKLDATPGRGYSYFFYPNITLGPPESSVFEFPSPCQQ